MVKTKKTKKSKKLRGTNSHGHGARKNWKGSGKRGGVGMAGTGKRADHKKTLITKKYGNKYFGKQGITSKSTRKKLYHSINIGDISKNLDSLMKKHGKDKILNLEKYRVLGDGELKDKVKIKALGFSKQAKDKIEKAGGEAILVRVRKEKVISVKSDEKKNDVKRQKKQQTTDTEKENKKKSIEEK